VSSLAEDKKLSLHKTAEENKLKIDFSVRDFEREITKIKLV